jgi:hypothetical protein
MNVETFQWQPASGWSADALEAGDSPQTLVLVFGDTAVADDPRPLAELAAAFPQSKILGCSTSGQILDAAISDGGLAVAVVRFDHGRLLSASAPLADAAGSFAAGRSLAEELADPELRSILVLSDGLGVNGSELVRGLGSTLPDSVVVTGGLAGDGDRFSRTWVLVDGEPRSGWVSAVGICGADVLVGHGSQGGWSIFGPERRITSSDGNVLYELDGKPALALYKSYLGELATGLPATALLFPLAVRAGRGDEQVVRTILAVDEERQSMTFAGDVPQGSLAQLMMGNLDRLVAGAAEAATASAMPQRLGSDSLAIAISCVGRRLLMSERTEEETAASLAALPAGTRQIGFYSYGELSPGAHGFCDLHNQTMTMTTLGEA